MQHFALHNYVPENMATAFAAYIYFMKAVKQEDGKYYGILNENFYPINDNSAAYFYEKWQSTLPGSMAVLILKDTTLWGYDLASLPGFANAVQEKINEIDESGMAAVINPIHSKKSIAL
jgi:tagaturonate reductase